MTQDFTSKEHHHSAVKAAPEQCTSFNYCLTCNDWYLPLDRIVRVSIEPMNDNGHWQVAVTKSFAPENGGGEQTFAEASATTNIHSAVDRLREMVTLSPARRTEPPTEWPILPSATLEFAQAIGRLTLEGENGYVEQEPTEVLQHVIRAARKIVAAQPKPVAPKYANRELTEQDTEELAEIGLNAACLAIQKEIGQDDGGVAALFFDGGDEAEFKRILRRYISFEEDARGY